MFVEFSAAKGTSQDYYDAALVEIKAMRDCLVKMEKVRSDEDRRTKGWPAVWAEGWAEGWSEVTGSITNTAPPRFALNPLTYHFAHRPAHRSSLAGIKVMILILLWSQKRIVLFAFHYLPLCYYSLHLSPASHTLSSVQ